MRGLLSIGAVVSLMALMFAVGWVVAKSGAGQGVDPASLTDLEREFRSACRTSCSSATSRSRDG